MPAGKPLLSKSFQVDNLADLLQYYENIKIPAFSLRSGSQLFFSYPGADQQEGKQLLEQMVTLLCSRSAAIWSLCLYPPGTKAITNKTEYVNSVNFRFNEDSFDDDLPERVSYRRFGVVPKEVQDQIGALTAEVAKLKTELSATEEPAAQTMEQKIGSVIDALGLKPLMPVIGQRLVDWIMPGTPANTTKSLNGPAMQQVQQQAQPVQQPQADAQGAQAAQEDRNSPEYQIAQGKRLQAALERLYKTCPDLIDLVDKMALMSERVPDEFQMYMTILRNRDIK